tara:strand:+ start:899 stop:1861 length:963 start_codon:yes stop_codon:yes gene_type:complete
MSNLVAQELVDVPTNEITGLLNPFNKNNILFTTNKIQNILKKYGIYHEISNESLYQTAMVHNSYSIPHINEVCSRDNVKVVPNPDGVILLQPESYERLECLGDAVIENIILSYLFKRYPDQPEGFLSFMKVNLVNRIMLSHLSNTIGLKDYLIISKTLDDKQNARLEDKILCDIFEAFIGAIFIDFNNISGNGYQVAEKFMINVIEDQNTELDFTKLILNETNHKDKFIKYSKTINKFVPKFKILQYGNNHDSTNKDNSNINKDNDNTNNNNNDANNNVEVEVVNPKTNEVLGKGNGKTIKKAEQEASRRALIKLGLLRN